ncbi:hypothetical protein B1H10_02985 [candidate division KSB1 bacterium 4484_188]|nr:MAG: hypothetical protein B1H10_02985 [candidate division KSB1 bacterium 4484_188]
MKLNRVLILPTERMGVGVAIVAGNLTVTTFVIFSMTALAFIIMALKRNTAVKGRRTNSQPVFRVRIQDMTTITGYAGCSAGIINAVASLAALHTQTAIFYHHFSMDFQPVGWVAPHGKRLFFFTAREQAKGKYNQKSQ